MTLRIIDNRRIDLTDAEWQLYQGICKSYDGPHRKGKDLFQDLFETNEKGLIVFLKPPTKKYSSMEVYMFLVGVMVHQHLGEACDQVNALGQKMLEREVAADKRRARKEEALNEKIKEAEDVILRANNLINSLKNVED